MNTPSPAYGAPVVVTLANSARVDRVAQQHAFLEQLHPGIVHGMVALDSETPIPEGVSCIARMDTLNLAHARNLAGQWAAQRAAEQAGGAEPGLIVFLDADCLPGPGLVEHYVAAAQQHTDAVLCGPVTYLPEGIVLSSPHEAAAHTNPHPVRPAPQPGEYPAASDAEYDVFWSLSFALRPATWRRCQELFDGFDKSFEGYGGEDTDFAWNLRAAGVSMRWCGGADAFHQWHPVSSPPWEHLEDIVANANRFHAKWGEWPMGGWLDEFEAADAISRNDTEAVVLR